MKKGIKNYLVLFCFTFVNFFTTQSALAEETVFTWKPMKDVLREFLKWKINGISEADSLFLVIMGWVSFFLPFAGLMAFVGIIYAGFLYLTGFANEDGIGKAKNILLWSIIGLILIFMAYAIVSTFVNPTGGS